MAGMNSSFEGLKVHCCTLTIADAAFVTYLSLSCFLVPFV